MKLEEAEALCMDLLTGAGRLGDHFSKWKVCGSIRRQKSEVNDIDIVAIKKPESEYGFGDISLSERVKQLDPHGEKEAEEAGRAGAARFLNGTAIKRFKFGGAMIDLYLSNDATFETLVLIRTGSKEHNVRLTTLAKGKGLKLKAGGEGLCRVKGGIYNNEPEEIIEIIDNTEDGILLKLLGRIPKPEERN